MLQCIGVNEMVYADDIYLMASSPEQLQALINALSSCCAMLHMEISVPKTKIMVFSPVPAPAVAFSCNDSPIEQEYHFKALGPSFSSVGCCCAFDQPNQVKGLVVLGLLSSDSILCCSVARVSICSYIYCKLSWCLSCSMGVKCGACPRVAAARHARLDMQRLYDYYLRTACLADSRL